MLVSGRGGWPLCWKMGGGGDGGGENPFVNCSSQMPGRCKRSLRAALSPGARRTAAKEKKKLSFFVSGREVCVVSFESAFKSDYDLCFAIVTRFVCRAEKKRRR